MLALIASYAAVLAVYGDPDWGPIYSGFLGLLLLAAALTAIGLLVSGLTANQVVAAVIAIGIGILLWMIDTLGYLLPEPFDTLSCPPLPAWRTSRPFATGRHVPLGRRVLPHHRPGRAAVRERPGAGAAIAGMDKVDGIETRCWFARLAARRRRPVRRWASGCAASPRLRGLPALALRRGHRRWPPSAVAVLANVALVLHDAHVDLTREARLHAVQAGRDGGRPLRQDVQAHVLLPGARIRAGRRAKDMVEVLGRRNPSLRVRTVDPDKQPTRRRDLRRAASTTRPSSETDGRRIQVMSTDEDQIALGILRSCAGASPRCASWRATASIPWRTSSSTRTSRALVGHSHGDGARRWCRCPAHGAGRLRRALESPRLRGPEDRPRHADRRIPADCAVVVDVNPRTTYLPGESEVLLGYLAQGGIRAAHVRSGLRPGAAPGLGPAPRSGISVESGRRDRSPRPLLDRSRGRGRARVRAPLDHAAASPSPSFPACAR